MAVTCSLETDLASEEFIDVLERSAPAGLETTLILLSAPDGMSYKTRAGLDPIDNG